MTPEEGDLLARIDVRLEYIQKKVDSFCEFKDGAAIDIANLKSHCTNTEDLPARVTALENWRWGLAGAFSLLACLIAWGWFKIV